MSVNGPVPPRCADCAVPLRLVYVEWLGPQWAYNCDCPPPNRCFHPDIPRRHKEQPALTANPEYIAIAANYDDAAAVLERQLDIARAAQTVPGLPLDFAAFWPPEEPPSVDATLIIATLWGFQIQQAADQSGSEPPGVSEFFAMMGADEVSKWVRDSASWCRQTARRIRDEDPALKIAVDDYLES